MTALEYKKLYESEQFKDTSLCVRDDFGAVYSKEKTVFHVWAPTAEEVKLVLYATGTDEEEGAEKKACRSMKKIEGGVWEAEELGDLDGVYYTYLVTHDGMTQECIDIYAKACGANGKRGMVIDLEKTNPEGFEEDRNWKQKNKNTFLYELHVKDFSYDINSGIKEEYRGKYLAFTQKGTVLLGNTSVKTGIDYLKELGVTHVHLLPVADFASIDETGENDRFNWGYDPANYNIPEGSYSTDPYHGEVRIKEFKQMVKALHDAGIGVVLDVVYNHTYASDSAFQKLAPYYYYRQQKDGRLADASACGNETASERFMYRQFMIQSVYYWAKEYHVDGFRFDLMGIHDTETMNLIRKRLNQLPNGKEILMYGEPWAADEPAMEEGYLPAVKRNLSRLDEGISIFSDDTRDTIKGSVFYGERPGYVNGKKGLEKKMKSVVCAWCDGGHEFTPKSPKQIITYTSAHDNYTLWDKLAITLQKNLNYTIKDRKVLKANKLTAAIVFTSKGIPFIQAGEEFGRTKQGDENSYKSAPSVNMLDWKRREEYNELVEYYKGLRELRQSFSGLHDNSMESISNIRFYEAEEDVVAFEITNKKGHADEWDKLFVVYNSNEASSIVTLPQGKWQPLVDGKSSKLWKNMINIHQIIKKNGKVEIEGLSAHIYGKRTKRLGGEGMDFFEKMGETITAKGKEAADKAKDVAEIVNLKNQIKVCEDVIKKNYMEIGKMYYESNADVEDAEYARQCTAIKNAQNGVKELEEKIREIKGI